MDNTIICPGCCWTGTREELRELNDFGICPECGYEDTDGGFLLTIGEILEEETGTYNDVDLPNFLRAVIDLFLKSTQ